MPFLLKVTLWLSLEKLVNADQNIKKCHLQVKGGYV